jgi:copper resistance protein C
MKWIRLVVPLLVAAFALFATAGPALAHTTLKSSDPADGATLDTAPQTVTLRFAEAVTLPADPVSVTGPTGEAWAVGTPTITGATVQVPVQASGPAGQYTLRYAVIADDGDAVRGVLHFTLTTATGSTAAPDAAATGQVGAPATEVTEVAAPVTVVTAAPATEPQAAGSSSGSSFWVWVAVAVVVVGVLGGIGFVLRGRRGADRF